MTGPGARGCTCKQDYIGDGLTCKGTVAKVSGGNRMKAAGACSPLTAVSLQEIELNRVTDFYFGLRVSDAPSVATCWHHQFNWLELCFQMVDITLHGRGPFTVFVPNPEALRTNTSRQVRPRFEPSAGGPSWRRVSGSERVCVFPCSDEEDVQVQEPVR